MYGIRIGHAHIRQVLLERSDVSALLLQALRWRLTKPARRQRKTAMAQYMQNELLEPQVLGALLHPSSPPPVREQALRLALPPGYTQCAPLSAVATPTRPHRFSDCTRYGLGRA